MLFFFNDTATTEIYTLSLHDALPIYFALQKIGAIPIAALVTHRYAEINQFVKLSGASTCVYPERQGDFEFGPMVRRGGGGETLLPFFLSLPPPPARMERAGKKKRPLEKKYH